jgi:hypothetical protein
LRRYDLYRARVTAFQAAQLDFWATAIRFFKQKVPATADDQLRLPEMFS